MARRAALLAATWVVLLWAVAAQALTFPALSGRVVDEAELLSAEDEASLTATLQALEERTTDQLVVVTLKSLQGTDIDDYGYQLGRHWEIGQKDKDNGVLLIVAPDERAVRIEVGYGLEGSLTDAMSRVIIETAILPRFRDGDFPGGIRAGAAAIVEILAGDPGEWQQRAAREVEAERPDNSAVNALLFFFVVFMVLGIYCLINGSRMCRAMLVGLFLSRGSSRIGRSSGGGGFSGGGGSFGGGGSSGRW